MLTTTRDGSRRRSCRHATACDLKVRCWWTVPRPRGMVVVAHGLGDHGGTYAHLAETVGGTLGLDFLALDFRGHGRSPGRRGVVRRYRGSGG